MITSNPLKKPALFALGVFAVYTFGYAAAYDPRTQRDAKPSVEINLDVLDKLGAYDNSTATAANRPNTNNAAPAGQNGPFGEPTSATNPIKKSEATKKKQHKKKHKVKKKPPAKTSHKAEAVPEIKVTPPKPEPEDNTNVPVVVPLPSEKNPQQQPVPLPLPEATKPAPEQPSTPALPPAPAPTPAPVPSPTPAPPPPPSPSKIEPLPLPSAPETKIQELPPVPAASPPSGSSPSVPSPPAMPPSGKPEAPSAPPALPPMPSASENPSDMLAKVPPVPGAEPAPSKPPAPATKSASGGSGEPDLRIVFGANETDVPLNVTSKLDSIALQLIKNPDLRASIIAYASGSDAISIYPKRVSLARGIAVRDYLTTARNIDVERVTVKALGNKSEAGPPDRVDIYLIQ